MSFLLTAYNSTTAPPRPKVTIENTNRKAYLATVKARKLAASVLRSHHEETRELPGERDNARNNARCTQARKTTHGLDGQH